MRRALPWIFLFTSLLLGLYLRDYYASDWLDAEKDSQGQLHAVVYQVEADAYARLARVQRILDGQGLIQRFHPQENYPIGIFPTTTAPFDYLILSLYLPAKIFFSHPLDWAGALVSPALYVALTLFLFWWGKGLPLRSQALLLFGAACLPGMIWATPFARPDHQSLTLALIAAAFCLELWRWHEPEWEKADKQRLKKLPAATATPLQKLSVIWANTNKPALFAGILWGLALWDTFYEPLILLVALIVFNLIVRRREQLPFLAGAISILLVSFAVEGFHLHRPPAELDSYLTRWLGTIGELRSTDAFGITVYFTFGLWLLPLFIVRYLLCGKSRKEDWFVVIFCAALSAAAFFQSRWLYFAAFAQLLLLSGWYARETIVWLRRLLLSILIIGVLYSIGHDMNAIDEKEPTPTPQLRHIGLAIREAAKNSTSENQGLLAPWWLSPALLYYSGQPILAGSSHMTISGIVDTARFFTTTSWIEADEILQHRKVRWVIVYIPERTLLNSRQILGLPTHPASTDKKNDPRTASQKFLEETVVERLDGGFAIPTRFRLRAVDKDCKLFEYVP
jgi:hypothetical protein